MRVVLGFLLAPLAVPLYFLVIGFLLTLYDRKVSFSEMGENAVGFLAITWPYAYFAALVLGLPSYLFLKSKDLLTWQVFTISGGVLGALVVIVFLEAERAHFLRMGLLPGALSGLVFWWIAIRARRSQGALDLD